MPWIYAIELLALLFFAWRISAALNAIVKQGQEEDDDE